MAASIARADGRDRLHLPHPGHGDGHFRRNAGVVVHRGLEIVRIGDHRDEAFDPCQRLSSFLVAVLCRCRGHRAGGRQHGDTFGPGVPAGGDLAQGVLIEKGIGIAGPADDQFLDGFSGVAEQAGGGRITIFGRIERRCCRLSPIPGLQRSQGRAD